MHSLLRYATCLGLVGLLGGFTGAAFAGQELTAVCLKSGVTIQASRVEPVAGGFQVLPQGAGSPMTISAEQVKTIGAVCEAGATSAPPASSAAPQAAPAPVVVPARPAAQSAQGGPRLIFQGSGAVGDELLPALVQGYGRKLGLTVTESSQNSGVREIAVFAPGAARPKMVFEIRSGSSEDAAKGLLEGGAVAGMSARRLTVDEAAAIAARFKIKPLSAESDSEQVLALDALTVITHKDNPITRLSLDQIASIFAGEIANWKDVRGWDENGEEVAGPNAAIRVQALDAGSENDAYFRASIMEPAKREMAGGAQRQPSGRALAKAVAADPGAIGFVSYAEIGSNRALKLAQSCGLNFSPTRFSVKTEEYPLARRLYLYTAGKPKDPLARDFLTYAVSNEAQTVIRDAGFIDQSMELQDAASQRQWINDLAANPLSGASTKALAAEKAGANQGKGLADFQKDMGAMLDYQTRTTVIFRFEPNSTSLDSRARQDIARAVSGWKVVAKQVHGFELVGFADWDGVENHNLPLAVFRARSVYKAMKKAGFTGELNDAPIGLGSVAPVACNDTAEGKAKNRRVELWAYTTSPEDMAKAITDKFPDQTK